MKFRQLVESRMDHFADVEKITFDPDRTDTHDIRDKLMPLLVKMGYVYTMEDKAKHEKHNPLDDAEVDEDDRFKLTTDVVADRVEDIIRGLVDILQDVSTDDIHREIKLQKEHFKTKLED